MCLSEEGSVWAWGSNGEGQLGTDSRVCSGEASSATLQNSPRCVLGPLAAEVDRQAPVRCGSGLPWIGPLRVLSWGAGSSKRPSRGVWGRHAGLEMREGGKGARKDRERGGERVGTGKGNMTGRDVGRGGQDRIVRGGEEGLEGGGGKRKGGGRERGVGERISHCVCKG
jgi:hypothetical protein